jgi:hypothetical protein
MSNLSDLGTFQLGQVQLGASVGQIGLFDSFSTGEATGMDATVSIADTLSLAEILSLELDIPLADAFAIAESGSFPTEGFAGILGRITLRMDVTSADFCAMVEESGMSVEINDTPERAYFFIKQRGQKFDQGIEIFPGDGVMFSCPDLDLSLGDEIKFAGLVFNITALVPHYIDGNAIYVKSACRKIRTIPDMPQVIGLVASPNLEGKTTLTWDAIDLETYEWFDYYEIYESSNDVDFVLRDRTKSTSLTVKNIVEDTVYYYKVRAIDKYGNAGILSTSVETPVDITPPGTPSGVR